MSQPTRDSDTASAKLKTIKREMFSRLQRDDVLMSIILEEISNKGSRGHATVESFLQNKKGALGSELLGELKQVVDLESLVVQRCWELMKEGWFEEYIQNVDL